MPTVTSIDALPLILPEPHYKGSPERCITLVRAETDDGLVGWGEAMTQAPEAALASKVLIERGLAPLVIGRDPVEVERLWREMCRQAWWYGVEGLAAFAISGIDMALWDLKGKVLGQPVAKLLGQLKDGIPAMASFIFDMDDLDWTLDEFRGAVEEGFKISKAGWGMRPDAMFGQHRELDLRFIRAVRETVGPEMTLVLDLPGARGFWDESAAIRRFHEYEEFDLRWIEQPLPPADLPAHRRLRAAVTTAVGAGEDEWSPETYKRLIDSEGVDVVQLDPARALGITGCMQVIAMVEAAGLKATAHTWSGAVNTAASLAILASSPIGEALDLKPHENPLQHELVEDPWTQVDGLVALRDEPGIGVTVREDAVAKYRLG